MSRLEPAHSLDVQLGVRIRARRRSLGLSQERLAERIGVSFQQVQKYERGENRIGFSRLVSLAEALDCSIAVLSGGLGGAVEDDPRLELLRAQGATELLQAYLAISDPGLRRAVLDHIEGLARDSEVRRRRRAD